MIVHMFSLMRRLAIQRYASRSAQWGAGLCLDRISTSSIYQLDNQAGMDNVREQRKLEATRSEMLDAKRAAESPASSAPEKMSGPSFYTRETGVQLTTAKVYSERASTQAVQSNGERVKRFP
jgi:hypothetical protein